jgi:hypothetical protein
MKRFFWRLLLFIVPVFLLFLFTEYKLRTIDSRYLQKRDGLLINSDSIEILVLGNSHADDGINPIFFSKFTYNLANSSQTLLYDDLIVRKYLPLLSKLKYALISLDYHSLYLDIPEDRDFLYDYYYDINIKNKIFLKEQFSFFFFVYSPTIAIDLICKSTNYKLNKGWEGTSNNSIDELSEKRGEISVDFFTNKIYKKIAENKQRIILSKLEALIMFLKSKNVTPILISTPCHSYYYSKLDNEIVLKNDVIINELKIKYHLNYINSLKDREFNSSDFYNADHLNSKGARKYSIFLNDTISKLITNY